MPREALRTLAGFTSEAGQFYLVCAAIVPSEDLCKKVYPYVDGWLEKLAKGEVAESSTAASRAIAHSLPSRLCSDKKGVS